MRKKNRYLKVLSILLVLCVLSQSMPAYAGKNGSNTGGASSGANNTSGNQPIGNDSAASRSSTTQAGKPSLSETKVGGAASSGVIDSTNGNCVFYRIGLAKLDNEEFQPYTNPDDLADAIQEYGKKYYVTTQGASYYYSTVRTLDSYGITKDALGRTTYTANASNAPYIATILQAVYTGNWQAASDFVGHRDDESLYILPRADIIHGVMSELAQIDSTNAALYDHFKAQSTSLEAAKHPVVIVIEICVPCTDGDGTANYITSAADFISAKAGYSAYRRFLSMDLSQFEGSAQEIYDHRNRPAGAVTSLTSVGMNVVMGLDKQPYSANPPWPSRITQRLFGTRWGNGKGIYKTSAQSPNFSDFATLAGQTRSAGGAEKGINGCTMVSLANVMETGVPLNDYPDGSYDWHIDAEDAVRNSSGHYEDQIVKLKTGYSATIQKIINVGSLNLYQKNHLEWEQYLANLDPGVTTVDVDVRTYHVGQINFTTDRSPILSGGSARTGNGIASSDQTSNLQTLTFTVEDFIKEINNRDSSIHLAVDVAGNDFVNGRLQVAYATTVTVRVDSASIPLTNDDVHWIVYTSGDNTTYVFQQIADPAYAQIKQGGLDNERYEAMAGTPTTEDLFVSMGGDQYIVQMQYAYCEDDYTRTYEMTANPTPNFDYYSVETPDQVSKGLSYDRSVDGHGDHRGDVSNWIATANGYWSDRDSYAASARAEAHSKLNSMVKGTNKATYGSMYEVCETGETADMKSFIDSTCVTGGSGGSQTFTLFKGTDPETGEPFTVDITVTIGISENAPNTSGPNYDGHHGPHYQHDNDGTNPAVPPVTDPNTGAVITPGTPATTIPCSHVYYDEYTSGSASVSFSYNVSFAITTTGIGNSCLGAPATISETQTVKQTFKNVKYMDILECHVWRLVEGREVGVGAILAEPVSTSTDVISAAVGQLGYAFYDADSTGNHTFQTSTGAWVCASSDLESTGRLVNSYNSGMNEITVGNYFNGDAHAFKVDAAGDTVKLSYDPATQGGRSHRSLHTFMAQAVVHTFYKSAESPYQNSILCTSDVLSLLAGDSAGSDWLTYCAWEFDSSEYASLAGLEQYIFTPSAGEFSSFGTVSGVVNLFNVTYSKDGKNTPATAIANDCYASALYNGGVVTLNNSPIYNAFDKKAVCELNPYTFVNMIDEENDMPRSGYKGDCLTSSVSHRTVNYNHGQGYNPTLSSVFNGNMDARRQGVTDLATAKKLSTSVATPAFPYKIGLNVNRTQPNNQYATGHAALNYEKIISKKPVTGFTPVVTSIQSYDDGYSTVSYDKLANTTDYPDGIFLEATYTDNYTSVNDVIIYNPSTAMDAVVLPQTEYLPDAQNTPGSDSVENPVRDQRVEGSFLSSAYDSAFLESGQVTSEPGTYTTTHKELREQSQEATSYYKMSDYTEATSTTHELEISQGSSWTPIQATNEYTISLYNGALHPTSVVTSLSVDDSIKYDGTALYRKAKPWTRTYDDVIAGAGVDSTGLLNWDRTSNLIPVSTGDKLSTSLSGSENLASGDVLHISVSTTAVSNIPFNVLLGISDTDAIATKTFTHNGTTQWDYYVEFGEDCSLYDVTLNFIRGCTITDMSFQFEDVFLMDRGGIYTDTAKRSGTIDHDVNGDDAGVRSYNTYCCDFLTDGVSADVSYSTSKAYLSYKEVTAVSYLKPSSADNPHKVYNKNWRYYVIGWKTTSGATIATPEDDLLYNNNTELKWPGTGETVTVDLLNQGACLVKYNGEVYLTLDDSARGHKIDQLGITVTQFDLFTLGSGSEETLMDDYPNVYPIAPGRNYTHLGDFTYEFCFQLAQLDGYLYDVSRATNLIYRYAMDDVNASKDWKDVETSVPVNSPMASTVSLTMTGLSEFLSLDDGFSIYYDNVGDYAQTNVHNIEYPSRQLGMGWKDGMDTVTWINKKYCVFDVDVYMFDMNDPTYGYENRTGLYFVAAGTPISLGTYEDDNGESDNNGRFHDYGAPESTHDPQGRAYTYNFWCALSTEEADSDKLQFESININYPQGTIGNTSVLNKDVYSPPERYADAYKNVEVAVVGRIGALTMIDTGDVRYSNTFKTTSPTADWQVYGLLRKLDAYSNEHGIPSTQRKILTDPFDVRGRIGASNLSRQGYANYTTPNSMNTYCAQWFKNFKDYGVLVDALPLDAAKNDTITTEVKEQKVGYTAYLTLESIGSYYGTSSNMDEGSQDPAVNMNDDHNDYKVQIRPFYIAVKFDDDGNVLDSYMADVYMYTGKAYEKINSGSTAYSDYMPTLAKNKYYYYMKNNTSADGLDQNMLRRMVTNDEAAITRAVTTATGWRSLLTVYADGDGLNSDLDPQYTYGNGQFLFLRDRNRTFVGHSSEALNYEDYDESNQYSLAGTSYADKQYLLQNAHAQEWYFGLGLPSSAVFVKSGDKPSSATILHDDHTYILTVLDVYSTGTVWTLHYKSPISNSTISIKGNRVTVDDWNPIKDKYPWLVPVNVYNTADTSSKADLTTGGSH